MTLPQSLGIFPNGGMWFKLTQLSLPCHRTLCCLRWIMPFWLAWEKMGRKIDLSCTYRQLNCGIWGGTYLDFNQCHPGFSVPSFRNRLALSGPDSMDTPSMQALTSHPYFRGSANADLSPDYSGQSRCATAPLSQADILDYLTQPSSYGIGSEVVCLQMRNCVLFLADQYCYKLRRHVPPGQNNPLSLNNRHQIAVEEMRLGERFAPELYLNLVPLRLVDGRLWLQLPDGQQQANASIKPSGVAADNEDGCNSAGDVSEAECFEARARTAPIVDWLVQLRRYDLSLSYDKLVDIHQPNFDDCTHLAKLALDSHKLGAAKPAEPWLATLAARLEHYDQTVRTLDRESRKRTLRVCLNRAMDRLAWSEDLVLSRGERGLIRQIHGNLRLGNVVNLPSGLRLVHPQVESVQDAVGDPLFDLAALIAELSARGLRRQANWVLSRYCNGLLDSQSLDGLKAFDLYLFIRAIEQAEQWHDHLIKRDESSCQCRDTHSKGACRGKRLLSHNIRVARQSLLQDEAVLLVIGGSNRANRSHLARLVAPLVGRMPGALYLSAEQELFTLYDVSDRAALPQSAYRASVWHLVYRRLADKARFGLDAGYSVILEGAYGDPVSRRSLVPLATDSKGAPRRPVSVHLYDPVSKPDQNGKISAKMVHADDLEAQYADHEGGAHAPELEGCLSLEDPGEDLSGGLGVPSEPNWHQWLALDATRPVGDLLAQTLTAIDPSWQPAMKGSLH